MKDIYIEKKEISYHFYNSGYIFEDKETKEKATLYNNGKGDFFVLTEPFSTDESRSMRLVYQILSVEGYRTYLERLAKKGFLEEDEIAMLVASYVSEYKRYHNPDEIGPDSALKVSDYEERALEIIRRENADADHNCFSGRYTISIWNDKEEFTDREGGYEYPGMTYPTKMRITEELFVLKLVEDGLKKI